MEFCEEKERLQILSQGLVWGKGYERKKRDVLSMMTLCVTVFTYIDMKTSNQQFNDIKIITVYSVLSNVYLQIEISLECFLT